MDHWMHIDIATLKSMSMMGGFYILEEMKRRMTANGKPFVSGKLSDASGSIEFVMWDDCPLTFEDVGKIVYVDATVSPYKGALQAKVLNMRTADEGEIPEECMKDLIPAAPIDIGKTFTEIGDTLVSIFPNEYAVVALGLLIKYKDLSKCCPAAKTVHHAFVGGWVMHTCNMLRMAKQICDQYGEHYHIDRALLLAGVVLHDIGKMQEFSLNEYGLVKQYSDAGKLLGHPVLGVLMVEEMAGVLEIPKERMRPLQHLILSHHGRAEYGAAVEPMCIEAQILSYLDGLDSRMEICRCALDKTEKGQFSDLIRTLNKQIYRVA